MVLYQLWFSEKINPVFDQEKRDIYRDLVENQFFPIGNVVDGRHLLRCMTEDFTPILEFLTSINKEVIVCGARYINGDYVTDQNGEIYPKNQVEFDKYMQDVVEKDTTLTPSDNTSAGWLSFNEIKPEITEE